jgi:hypothetical protein
MRTLSLIAVAVGILAASPSAYAWKPGYPQKGQHCHMVKQCHKNTDFPCANNAEPNLPICKKLICSMVQVCDQGDQ